MNARCKFKCVSVEDFGNWQNVTFSAQYDEPLSKEDQSFSTLTPSGTLKAVIQNPNVKFNPGKDYYIDITSID